MPGIVLAALLLGSGILLSEWVRGHESDQLIGSIIVVAIVVFGGFGPMALVKIFEHTGIGMAVTILASVYYTLMLIFLGIMAERGKEKDRKEDRRVHA